MSGYNTGYNAGVIVSFWESCSAPPTWDLGLLTVEIIRVLQQHQQTGDGDTGALHLDHTDKGLQQVNFFSNMWIQLACGTMTIDMFYIYYNTLFISLFHTTFNFKECCLLTQKVNKDIL